jgi:hypothetical protein
MGAKVSCRQPTAGCVMRNLPSYTDPPFACPPDIVIDLPVPPSVNKLRKADWAAFQLGREWIRAADAYVFAAKCRHDNPLKLARIPRYELVVVIDEHQTGMDLDNGLKALIDYLVRVQVLENDAKKNLRKLTVEWGHAPHGVRVIVKPMVLSVKGILEDVVKRAEAAG